jgi:uncharacterized protein YutE (UPF0331/DUF86 family)
MTPRRLKQSVISTRTEWVAEMVRGLEGLPLDPYEQFIADERNAAAAESYLRRGLEGLLDLGRHILSKGFGRGVAEYKEIPRALEEGGVIDSDTAVLFRQMAGYRNRLVHFYGEIHSEELHEIVTVRRSDILLVLEAMKRWIREHPERVDKGI